MRLALRFFWVPLWFAAQGFAAQANLSEARPCFEVTTRAVLQQSGASFGEQIESWEIQFLASSESQIHFDRVERFRAAVLSLWSESHFPQALLARQRALFFGGGFTGIVHSFDQILSGQIGELGTEQDCFETQLFDTYLSQSRAQVPHTEFMVLLFSKEGSDRILFVHNPFDAIIFGSGILRQTKEQMIANGYEYQLNLHNHPFNARAGAGGSSPDFAGTTIPSGTDAFSYRRDRDQFGLKEAAVINGFSSLHISAEQFDLLKDWQ